MHFIAYPYIVRKTQRYTLNYSHSLISNFRTPENKFYSWVFPESLKNGEILFIPRTHTYWPY